MMPSDAVGVELALQPVISQSWRRRAARIDAEGADARRAGAVGAFDDHGRLSTHSWKSANAGATVVVVVAHVVGES